jgi:hypothetical protein
MRGAILGTVLIGLGYMFNTQSFEADERVRDNKGRPVPKIGVNKTGNNYWGKQSLPYHMWKYRHPACLRVYAEGWGVDLKTLSSKEKAYLKELYDEDIDTQNALKSLIRKHGVRATKAPSDLKGSSAPVKASTTSSTQTTLVGGGGFGSIGGFGMPLTTTPTTPPKPAPTPKPAPPTPPTDIPQVKAMLALDFMKHGHAIQFPAIVQRKLDGVRCLASRKDGKVILQSRQNNAFHDLDHIREDIQDMQLPSNIILDGELYSHAGKLTFQKLAGLVRRQSLSEEEKEEIKEIRYHVYDMIDLNNPDRSFTDRHAYLQRLVDNGEPSYIDLVENFEVGDVDEADELHSQFVRNGYEGLMFRNKDSPYEGKRSRHLQKYKKFDDDEFEIVGYEEARGKDVGSVIWVLQTEDGQKFRARPTGTIQDRRKMFTDGDSYIGKMLTVKYFGLTDGGIPRFPIGITVRDYEAETYAADKPEEYAHHLCADDDDEVSTRVRITDKEERVLRNLPESQVNLMMSFVRTNQYPGGGWYYGGRQATVKNRMASMVKKGLLEKRNVTVPKGIGYSEYVREEYRLTPFGVRILRIYYNDSQWLQRMFRMGDSSFRRKGSHYEEAMEGLLDE